MLMEIWEWLRGYRKWTQVDARVEFLKEEHLYHDKDGKDLHYTYVTGDRLVWTDAHGQPHYAVIEKSGKPTRYPLTDGEPVDLHYNPANPDQFYSRLLSEMKVRRFFAIAFTVIAVAAISICYMCVQEIFGCSR